MASNIHNEIAMENESDCKIRETPTTYVLDTSIDRYDSLGSINLNQDYSSVKLLQDDSSKHTENWQAMPKNRRKQKKSASINMTHVINHKPRHNDGGYLVLTYCCYRWIRRGCPGISGITDNDNLFVFLQLTEV